jgi:hypothetical protein
LRLTTNGVASKPKPALQPPLKLPPGTSSSYLIALSGLEFLNYFLNHEAKDVIAKVDFENCLAMPHKKAAPKNGAAVTVALF